MKVLLHKFIALACAAACAAAAGLTACTSGDAGENSGNGGNGGGNAPVTHRADTYLVDGTTDE